MKDPPLTGKDGVGVFSLRGSWELGMGREGKQRRKEV